MVPRYFNSKPHRSWWLLTSCCTKDDFDCLWKLFIYIDVLWTSSHPWTGELKNAFYFNRSVALRWKSPLIKKRLPSILYDWKTKDYKRCIQNGALWLFCHMAQYTCIPFVLLTLIVSVCVRVFWVLRCAVMQVYNSWTWAVKPQWSTGICKVSCSGFVIRCKKLNDPLRQEKSKPAGRRHSLFTDIYLWLTLITWILSRNGDGGKSRWERSVSQLFG